MNISYDKKYIIKQGQQVKYTNLVSKDQRTNILPGRCRRQHNEQKIVKLNSNDL